ncbi:hypothetical protein [Halovivax asiaticus]|nr:hypothetical protein [Halovivax asiaticus]
MAGNPDMSFQREVWLIIPFSMAVAVSLGMLSTDLVPFIDLGQILFEFGNIEFSLARGIAVACLLAVFVNRDVGFADTSGVDLWIVYATIGLILAPPLFPALQGTLAEAPAAFAAFGVQTTGFTLVSYLN